jgi:hypothetical protein
MNLLLFVLSILLFLYFVSILNKNTEKFASSPSVNSDETPQIYGYTVTRRTGYPWLYEIKFDSAGGCSSKRQSSSLWTGGGYNDIYYCYNDGTSGESCENDDNCIDSLKCGRLNKETTTPFYCMTPPPRCSNKNDSNCMQRSNLVKSRCNDNRNCVGAKFETTLAAPTISPYS